MSRRIATIFHWLGLLAAVLAIGAAVVWNAETFHERRAAQEHLRTLPPALENRDAALVQAFARQRASTEKLKRSLTGGGVLVLGGLIVYGLGLAVYSASRRRRR